ncbi:MAG: hypothetical protein KAW41_05540 [Candidatus Diapherotrites archaeon]|nr:hypothetical protein [Candidatus Diapherotrites archaeon]
MRKNKGKTLGKKGFRLVSRLEREGKAVVSMADVRKIVGGKKRVARDLMHRLTKGGWFDRLERDKYVLIPTKAGEEGWWEHQWLIVPNLVSPYYVSYVSAMNFWGFTEQIPISVYVATTKQKKDITRFHGVDYKFVTLSKHKFFGWEEVELKGGPAINMASKEKTVVDCFDKPQYSLGVAECAKALYFARREINAKKLCEYALKMRNKTLVKRLGYVMDKLGVRPTKPLHEAIKRDTTAVPLSTFAERRGGIDKKWKVIKNIEDKQLFGFLEGF